MRFHPIKADLIPTPLSTQASSFPTDSSKAVALLQLFFVCTSLGFHWRLFYSSLYLISPFWRVGGVVLRCGGISRVSSVIFCLRCNFIFILPPRHSSSIYADSSTV